MPRLTSPCGVAIGQGAKTCGEGGKAISAGYHGKSFR